MPDSELTASRQQDDTPRRAASPAETGSLPAWPAVLRALREARGITQEGWAARLGYSARTVQRWERGTVVPDAAAEAAFVALCQETGAFRSYDHGPLAGFAPTAAWLQDLLARARLGTPAAAAVRSEEPAPQPASLPVALTSFVGRERELSELRALLGTVRLLTLTGPGGTGKTRLALEAAADQAAAFSDGVFFVDLAPLRDPTLVVSAIARTLGIQGSPNLPLVESVVRFLRDQRVLLVLDNYEHLLAAADIASTLLQAAPDVALLVTSRAPLRIRGEREYAVLPLPLPNTATVTTVVVADNPAVALFVARAGDVRADFALNDGNVEAVAAICARLDGLPLAIELAAARVRALPPEALLTQLQERLPVLSGGARDAPARQQTLRNAIDWSYVLLEPQDQRLFRRLAVFAGGCTLQLAAAVCDADGDLGLDLVDGVSSLVEKSLLRLEHSGGCEPRYRMLETIREFALEKLETSGEADSVRQQLAVQILQFAQTASDWARLDAAQLVKRAAADWARLDLELDNARAVLGWCVERAELAPGVHLLWDLRWYMFNRGHANEQDEWRRRLLGLPEAELPGILRARLLAQPPRDWLSVEEQTRATAELEEAVGLSRQFGDVRGLVQALHSLAYQRTTQGMYQASVSPAEEALSLYLEAGDALLSALMQNFLIRAAIARDDIPTAERLVVENRALEAASRSTFGLVGEAQLTQAHGDYAQARVFLQDALQSAVAATGEGSSISLVCLASLARVLLREGDTQAAVATCAESLNVQRRVGPSRYLAPVLTVLARAAERSGLLIASVRLLAAADVQRREFAAEVLDSSEEQQALVERIRAALGEAAFTAAWAEGAALSADASIEPGLAVVAEIREILASAEADVSAEPAASP